MKPCGWHNGMRSFPSESRREPSPEWNHYRIVCEAGVIRLHVNGKEVSGGEDCVWSKGCIGLESEGSPTERRNLRIISSHLYKCRELAATTTVRVNGTLEGQPHARERVAWVNANPRA